MSESELYERIGKLERAVYRLALLIENHADTRELPELRRIIDAVPLSSRIQATNDRCEGR